MVEQAKVMAQLSKVGYKAKMFQRAEVKELCNVLHEDEIILQATNGYYEGGFGLMVATSVRILLVDKKPMFLTLDSISYSMIQEVTFNYRLLNSTIHIFTSNKCLDFNSWNHAQIRAILNHTQQAMRVSKQPRYAEPPLPANQYMQYEEVSAPEIDMEEVPTMPHPIPPHFNENTESVLYASTSATVDTLPLQPNNLNTDTKISPYQASGLAERRYLRRYY